MKKGRKGFSESEKKELKEKLCSACKESWAIHGYKKTSIGELTATVGISTGAFYILYESKEELFCETLQNIQDELKKTFTTIIKKNPDKEGFIEGLTWHFNEYQKFPFLYDSTSADFKLFISKLPQEKVEDLQFDSIAFFKEIVKLSNLTLKVSFEKAFAAVNALLYTVTIKEELHYDISEIFAFLLTVSFDSLFE